jgi:hypothetical protein
MTFGQTIATLFRMDDASWARHASPWSVWTRVVTGPLLLVALWSHAWLGWWALGPIALVLVWTWLNPHLFPPPKSTDTWAARATFGERVWLNRDTVPIPAHHARVANILSVVAGAGFLAAVVGALLNDLATTLAGGISGWFAKIWFCDRMVWLYEDMKDVTTDYRSWLR